MRPIAAAAIALTVLSACGGGTAPSQTASSSATVDPAALYCQGTGGTIIPRTSGGRRADLCRTSDGRTVAAADLLNSHNDL